MEAGDWDGARRAHEHAIDSRHPDHAPSAWVMMGMLLEKQGNQGEANGAYRAAVDSGNAEYAPLAAVGLGVTPPRTRRRYKRPSGLPKSTSQRIYSAVPTSARRPRDTETLTYSWVSRSFTSPNGTYQEPDCCFSRLRSWATLSQPIHFRYSVRTPRP
ncbi:tetratricopeptide repeat protein [Pseudarthrobacter humi]|uniref:tetratricopeptide repeat protein n=1 Tax=Pseudarthrobacter humi TaxID=2952523 RepID=UPI003555CCE5